MLPILTLALFKAVDRALRDTSRRYERTKNQIGLMKDHENRQKEMVTAVQVSDVLLLLQNLWKGLTNYLRDNLRRNKKGTRY